MGYLRCATGSPEIVCATLRQPHHQHVLAIRPSRVPPPPSSRVSRSRQSNRGIARPGMAVAAVAVASRPIAAARAEASIRACR
eukprot:CAMPEP_0115829016 /NCGR_PEP_ID=MMETSP0287-20121206/879_1 /TAXON_ID=412157 /ORGANISM="Chrysochromulina rotalis, Strain UIO044" /LENGTH=82 /DNA_ID=CAMNT_0003282265 /DNA_START=1448 /DNA_END=1692 /DNA_ORIENTATION=-